MQFNNLLLRIATCISAAGAIAKMNVSGWDVASKCWRRSLYWYSSFALSALTQKNDLIKLL
jgi:hypothetical protein